MSVESDLQLPVSEAGYDFPRLEMADLIAWAAQVHTARRIAAEKRYAKNGPGGASLTEFERQKMIQGIIDREVELGDLMVKAYTPEGIHKTLVASLAKAGKTDAEALAVLKRIHFTRQARLAEAVLSPPQLPAEPKADEPNPPVSDTAETT